MFACKPGDQRHYVKFIDLYRDNLLSCLERPLFSGHVQRESQVVERIITCLPVSEKHDRRPVVRCIRQKPTSVGFRGNENLIRAFEAAGLFVDLYRPIVTPVQSGAARLRQSYEKYRAEGDQNSHDITLRDTGSQVMATARIGSVAVSLSEDA